MRRSIERKRAAKKAVDWKRNACLVLAVLASVGCANQAEPIHVRGTVSFRGKAVPSGLVVIHPDTAKGNQGERGYAAIKNGHFDTRIDNGKGAMPGAVKFVVGGTEATTSSPEMESKPLFPPYQFETEVTPSNATFDIKVPG
jgi:hypothetical protein